MTGFPASSRVLIVAGKGGVGKTTLGATIGFSAARAGVDTLLIELEGHSSLGHPFGIDALPYQEQDLLVDVERHLGPVPGRLRGRRLTPDDALLEYLAAHGLDRVGSKLLATGAVEVVSTAAPGIRDVLALGKIRQLETASDAELIVVDAPAAGHAISFLRSPAGLADSTTAGPVREQADAVLEMLADDRRCQVMLVTLPEETPVTELVETAFDLEDEVGVKLAPVVVNGVWPTIEGLAEALDALPRPRTRLAEARKEAAVFRLARCEAQSEQIRRLTNELALPTVTLPQLFTPTIDIDAMKNLGGQYVSQMSALV